MLMSQKVTSPPTKAQTTRRMMERRRGTSRRSLLGAFSSEGPQKHEWPHVFNMTWIITGASASG
jgi:hypothetical protein